jgi:hypothetical protein
MHQRVPYFFCIHLLCLILQHVVGVSAYIHFSYCTPKAIELSDRCLQARPVNLQLVHFSCTPSVFVLELVLGSWPVFVKEVVARPRGLVLTRLPLARSPPVPHGFTWHYLTLIVSPRFTLASLAAHSTLASIDTRSPPSSPSAHSPWSPVA